jgi:hypothetical protein
MSRGGLGKLWPSVLTGEQRKLAAGCLIMGGALEREVDVRRTMTPGRVGERALEFFNLRLMWPCMRV